MTAPNIALAAGLITAWLVIASLAAVLIGRVIADLERKDQPGDEQAQGLRTVAKQGEVDHFHIHGDTL